MTIVSLSFLLKSTKFNFSGPVYLQENVEYCFVVLANSNEYNAYVGRLGETVIGCDRTISQQMEQLLLM